MGCSCSGGQLATAAGDLPTWFLIAVLWTAGLPTVCGLLLNERLREALMHQGGTRGGKTIAHMGHRNVWKYGSWERTTLEGVPLLKSVLLSWDTLRNFEPPSFWNKTQYLPAWGQSGMLKRTVFIKKSGCYNEHRCHNERMLQWTMLQRTTVQRTMLKRMNATTSDATTNEW